MILGVLVIALSPGCGGGRQEDIAPPGPGPQGVARKLQRPNRTNELREIALFFTQFLEANRQRPPANVKAFKDSLKLEAGRLYQALEEGYYGVNLHARFGSTQIVAYEAEPDEAGHVMVSRMDSSVHTLTVAELLAELGK